MEGRGDVDVALEGLSKPTLRLETTQVGSQKPEAIQNLAGAVQEAADHVEVLVEKASELLGRSLDDSSLNKLAQLSKEMGIEQDHSLEATGERGSAEDEEDSESHVSGVQYVTAPSSPIIHVSAMAVSGEEVTTTLTPSLSRKSSKDGNQVLGRKLRFTTITGEVEREGKGRSSLDVDFKDFGNRSDPGTPNLSETQVALLRNYRSVADSFILQRGPDSAYALPGIRGFPSQGRAR